jgi:hypothetical protein
VVPTLTLTDFERDALDTLTTYATIPCLSPDYDHQWSQHGYIERATELLAEWARQRAFANADVTIHRLDGRTPVLVVTIDATSPGNATAVLYGHLDKQPPLGDWSPGLEPYRPVRRGDRLFARGVADDGYSTFSALLAVENMEANNIPHSRIVVLIEASEESGSPDLEAYLDELANHLGNVELMICLDSGALTYDRLWVTTSLRGMLHVELTIKVLTQGQHSGSASGVVPSSFRILRQLLDRVEDANTGDVLLDELKCEIPSNYVNDAAALAQEFGDVIAHELPTLDGLELMGDFARRPHTSTHLVSHAVDRRHGRNSGARDRRQRAASFHHGGALLSVAAHRRRRARRLTAVVATLTSNVPVVGGGHHQDHRGRRLDDAPARTVAARRARIGVPRSLRSRAGIHRRGWDHSISRVVGQALPGGAVCRHRRARSPIQRPRHRRDA